MTYKIHRVMCRHRTKQTCCLAAFFTYQVALIYVWILFILSSNDIAELMYCPQRITGQVVARQTYNHTDE